MAWGKWGGVFEVLNPFKNRIIFLGLIFSSLLSLDVKVGVNRQCSSNVKNTRYFGAKALSTKLITINVN